MPKRKITSRTCSARTRNIARFHSAAVAGASALLAAAIPVLAASDAGAAPSVTRILAAYAQATGGASQNTASESSGTLTGDGLSGDFHSWRSGSDERDDERLGPGVQTTLRRGGRFYVKTPGGNVRELTGYLRRRALTADFVDSGAFVTAPERSRLRGVGELRGARVWRLEVQAPGGEPETLSIDAATGLPLRIEYLDGDGTATLDLSDWRTVGGRYVPFRRVTSDGDPAFDIVQQTTSIVLGAAVPAGVFDLPANRTIAADGVHIVPLLDRDAHVACSVAIGGKPYEFLLDTGAQSILLDARVATEAGLQQAGSFEVRGMARSGGLHVVEVPRLDIGPAHLDDFVAASVDLRGVIGSTAHIDGILGVPFFASALVELDFARHTMRFGPPGSFVPRGRRLPLDLDRGLVESVLRVNGSIDAPFAIDTGNSVALLLYGPFVEAHPDVAAPSSQSASTFGIGGTVPAYRSVVEELALGDVVLRDSAADVMLARTGAFADRVDAGNVGLGILRKYVLTFDLANAAMYIEDPSR